MQTVEMQIIHDVEIVSEYLPVIRDTCVGIYANILTPNMCIYIYTYVYRAVMPTASTVSGRCLLPFLKLDFQMPFL